MRTQVKLYIV